MNATRQHAIRTGVLLVFLLVLTACRVDAPGFIGQFPPTPTLPAPPGRPTISAAAPAEATADATPVDQQTAVPPEIAANPTPSPAPAPCPTPGQIITGTYASTLNGLSRYRIYLPPCYGEDGRVYPTLTLLPGNIHDDSIWDQLGIDETAETLINQGSIPPLLIVMADSGSLYQNTSGGPGSYESQILSELIPFVEATYCAWGEADGRAIGGLSRGGYWALEIAFRHPGAFASAGGHSAALVDSYAGPDLSPQFTGINNPLGDLRVYLDIGEFDGYRLQLEQLHNDMAARAIAHDWTLNPGAHANDYWAAHTADYLLWYTRPWPHERDTYPPCQL